MSVGSCIRETLLTSPLKFQIQGVRFLEALNGRGILGDDMGLGKTYQAIAYSTLHPEASPVVVVCPASIKYQWQRQFKQHSGRSSQVLEAYREFGLRCLLWRCRTDQGKPRPTVQWFRTERDRSEFVQDNRQRLRVVENVQAEPRPALTEATLIINYEILGDWLPILLALRPRLLILDEFHYIKSDKAQRTKACRKLAGPCEHVLGLSGTPFGISPVELWPILSIVAPGLFPSFWKYAFRYCDPKPGFRGRGWDFSGASNLEELHELVSRVMIRRKKTEVMKELPPKIRTTTPIEIDNREEYRAAEDSFLEWLEERKGEAARKRASGAVCLVKLGALKHLAAEGKLRQAQQWVTDFQEGSGEKLIIFTYHKHIIQTLQILYPHAARIDGSTPQKKRPEEVDRFVNDPNCRIFLGQMKAAGIGTDGLHKAASSVLFLEIGWTPMDHEQCEDRALRIGTTASSVNVYYMVAANTVEEKILEKIEQRSDIVGKVLDGDTAVVMSLLNYRRNHGSI